MEEAKEETAQYDEEQVTAAEENAEIPMEEMTDSETNPGSEETGTEPETVPYPGEEEDDRAKEEMTDDEENEGGEDEEENDLEGSYTAVTQEPKKYETQLAAARSKTTTRHRRVAHKHITLPRVQETEDMMDEDMEGQLAIDVYHTEDDIIIKSTIAGVDPEDLDINIAGDTVTIHGERKKDHEISNESYYYQECYWGSFSRSIVLPVEVDGDKAEAGFQNGILTIRLPKVAKNKLKKIRVTKR